MFVFWGLLTSLQKFFLFFHGFLLFSKFLEIFLAAIGSHVFTPLPSRNDVVPRGRM